MPMLIVVWNNPQAESQLAKFEAEGLDSGVFLIPPGKESAFTKNWQRGGGEPQGMVVLRITGMDAYYTQMASAGASELLKDTFKGIKNFQFG